MTGQEVRELLRRKRLYHWELAKEMRISEFTLSRHLRGPLDDKKEQAILAAIDRLTEPTTIKEDNYYGNQN